MTKLWGLEPVRIMAVITAAIVAIVAELGTDAPVWLTLVMVALVAVGGEIGRSQVTPVAQL